ncbi:pyridoxamine 5'-phosphate oxidase family protein [Streptomyces naphthomycinicus]|uniref:pyridoxamine 5'-phosphate oxidase family protein n=1 Tax=Streptomyces naphthomycinicus TaxID=2872625 RepID=UPI001CECFFE0|nr:pyridoxamine 5'-phosphate oxidase family protein [Streptomyces sp. TML10]
MKITEPARTGARRKRDLLARLEREMDIWVATADAEGLPCLVALWFVWDGESIWMCTRGTNPTGRNLRDGGRTRLALGHTRDVVLIDGEVRAYGAEEVPAAAADAFAARTGWDPRADSPAYVYFRVRPYAVQSWHGVHELRGRHLMRDGAWAV